MRKDILYAFCCLAFAVIIGGAVYEHLNVVPQWAAAPPASLTMFQGPYGLKPELFWMLIHPINLVLFAAALIMHWKSPRKKPLLLVLSVYITILVITSIYFVPELLHITQSAVSPTPDAELTRRAGLWETLSLVRLGILVILSIILFTGMAKPAAAINKERKSAGRQATQESPKAVLQS